MANLLGVKKGNARPLVSPKGRRVTGCATRCITVSNTGLFFYRNSQKGGLGLGHNPKIRNSSRTLNVIESTQKMSSLPVAGGRIVIIQALDASGISL